MFTDILVAVDGSTHAAAALAQAYDLARSEGGRVTIASAFQPHPDWLSLVPEVARDDLVQTRLREQTEKLLREAAAGAPPGVEVSTRLLEGSPTDAILAELDGGSYDLVVIGMRGLGGLAAMFLGSVSHSVLQRTPVPALVVRANPAPATSQRT